MDKIIKEEELYLNETLSILKKDIIENELSIDSQKEVVNNFKKFIWQNKGEMTDVEYNMTFNDIDNSTSLVNEKIKKLMIYKKALKAPFFARVDFEDSEELTKVYIGITNIMDGYNIKVFDWRAPVSSLFYNYSTGPSHYETPVGVINGNILLRRQYKINNGKLERVIQSDINIDDDYLQELLASNSGEKMKNIVTTIQKEQNKIIRNSDDKHFIIQGIAGSGKTSIVFHRLAYLFYQRKDLNPNNVLLISPNPIFSNYVSDILPDLGESSILESTFADLASHYLFRNIQTLSEFLNHYYNNDFSDLENEINVIKFSDSYILDLKEFLNRYLEEHKLEQNLFFDIDSSEVFISKDVVNNMLLNKNNLSLNDLLNAVIERICSDANIKYKKNANKIRKALLSAMNIDLDYNHLYASFLNTTYKKSKKINYEDIIPLLFLKFEIEGYPANNMVKLVVIDEVQDYSKMQLFILKKLFPHAKFMLVGDVNQNINPYYSYETLHELEDIFQGANYYELNKAYRSSPEIIDYSNNILSLTNQVAVRNRSNITVEKKYEGRGITKQILSDISSCIKNGMSRIAVITKNNIEAVQLYKKLKPHLDMVNLAGQSSDNNGVIIIPSYIAKGLEFDAVILYTGINNPYSESERNLYYVVCTRAQHQLIVYNQKELSLKMETGHSMQLKKA